MGEGKGRRRCWSPRGAETELETNRRKGVWCAVGALATEESRFCVERASRFVRCVGSSAVYPQNLIQGLFAVLLCCHAFSAVSFGGFSLVDDRVLFEIPSRFISPLSSPASIVHCCDPLAFRRFFSSIFEISRRVEALNSGDEI